MTPLSQLPQHERYRHFVDAVPIVDPACEGKTDLFFSERTIDLRAAQLICSTCSLKQSCLEDARINPPFAGVWGGVIFVNGQEQIFKRGRGRPPKDERKQNARLLQALSTRNLDEPKSRMIDQDREDKRNIA